MLIRSTILAVVAIAATLAPAGAHNGVTIDKIKKHADRVTITVTFSNGDRRHIGPCFYEDSRRCYWRADRVGNLKGRSYIRAHGDTFYVAHKRLPR